MMDPWWSPQDIPVCKEQLVLNETDLTGELHCYLKSFNTYFTSAYKDVCYAGALSISKLKVN